MSELQLRAEMCEVGRRLWQQGLVSGTEGNFSCRLPNGNLLCTPRSASKGHMKPDDLLEITLDGTPVRVGIPSSEIKLHLVIYQERPDCMAVVHAHPATVVGLELAGILIPDNILPESAIVLGPIGLSPFGMPRTTEVPDGIRPLLADHKTIVMSHHGAVTLGNSLTNAWSRMEILEKVARMVHVAHTVGAPRAMPAEAFEELLKSSLNAELEY